MAAINFGEVGETPESGGFTAILNWGGALLSVLLVAGLAFWGWQLWQRDVSGVPVVRALEGPMRVAPEDPGGLASDYQGLSVNSIAEETGDANLADRVVLAPAAIALTSEDVPTAELPAAPAADDLPVVELAPSLVPVEDETTGVEVVAVEPESIVSVNEGPSAIDLAVAAALSEADLQAAIIPEVTAAAHVPSQTPRPLVRPASLQTVAVATSDVTGDIDPATIPIGTPMVQLGAFGSADVARVEWANLMAQHGNYMAGKERVIVQARVAERDYWRLRAMGFTDANSANQLCAALIAEGLNCMAVTHK